MALAILAIEAGIPGVRIVLRADAGFALPEILQVCERSEVGYAIGFPGNGVLERKIADLLERARLACIQTGQKHACSMMSTMPLPVGSILVAW